MTQTARRQDKRPSIADVAREAGVSTATVSFVLTGRGQVSEGTQEHVLTVVRRLGYQRNRHARALRRGGTPTVSAVVPDVTNPFMAELIAATESAASQRGWLLSLMNCQLDPQRELAYLETAFDEVPDGILYVPMTAEAAENIDRRLKVGPPTVFVDSITSRGGIGGVTSDHDAGARLVARHLHETGRRRVLFTGPPLGLPTDRARSTAFYEEAEAMGLDVASSDTGVVPFNHAVAVAVDLLLADRTIDAYFAGNDLIAIEVLAELHRHGLRVPHDVAICGFDGIGLAKLMSPRLTTVQQPVEKLATAAVELIVDGGTDYREIVLPVELFVGETT